MDISFHGVEDVCLRLCSYGSSHFVEMSIVCGDSTPYPGGHFVLFCGAEAPVVEKTANFRLNSLPLLIRAHGLSRLVVSTVDFYEKTEERGAFFLTTIRISHSDGDVLVMLFSDSKIGFEEGDVLAFVEQKNECDIHSEEK